MAKTSIPQGSAPEQSSSTGDELKPGDRITSHRAGRAGTVTKVYPDGSASICWDDGPPQPEGMGHERVPGEFLKMVRPEMAGSRNLADDHAYVHQILVFLHEQSDQAFQQIQALSTGAQAALDRGFSEQHVSRLLELIRQVAIDAAGIIDCAAEEVGASYRKLADSPDCRPVGDRA